jgi:hypothetical protein
MEILLDRLVLLHAADAKTNICIPIPVERDFGSLEFVCAYEPKGYDDEAAAKRLIEEGINASAFVPALFSSEGAGLDPAPDLIEGLKATAFEPSPYPLERKPRERLTHLIEGINASAFVPALFSSEGAGLDPAPDLKEGSLRFVPEEYRKGIGPPEQFLPSVVSLITLSLDYNGRYLGCAHRHAPEQRHIISADFSSPGFLRQPALAGDWQAVINVHSVVCGEVRYHLRVLAHDEYITSIRILEKR